MHDAIVAEMRNKVAALLVKRAMTSSLAADEPLFTSGLLDSLAATEVMMVLERDYGVDLAADDFDIMRIDTLDGMAHVIVENGRKLSIAS